MKSRVAVSWPTALIVLLAAMAAPAAATNQTQEADYPDRDWDAKYGENASAADDGSYAYEECLKRFYEARAEFEKLMMESAERMRQFHDEFASARSGFGSHNHTDEEWRAFESEWRQRADEVEEQLRHDFESRLKALVGADCAPAIPDGAIAMPAFLEAKQAYDYPAPPADSAFDRAVHEIRVACEEKAHALKASWDASTGNEEDLRHRIQALLAECEQRIKALYLEHAEGKHEERWTGTLRMFWDEDRGRIIVEGRHLRLEGLPETQTILDVSCHGSLLVDRLFVDGWLQDFRPEASQEGTALRVYDSARRMVLGLHDNPRCLLNMASSADVPAIMLDLADHLSLNRTESGDYALVHGNATVGKLLLHGANASLESGNVLRIAGRATLLMGDGASDADQALGPRYKEAVFAKRVGAEVRIAAKDGGLAHDAAAVGDLEIEVRGGPGKVDALVESKAGHGKTVLFEIERGLFADSGLAVNVWAVGPDGSESPLLAREASDLDDVLDPADDDAVEYWIVEDKNGFHVLVSFPHFSQKRVSITSADEALRNVPGLGAALALMAVLAGAFIALRRR